MCLLVCLFGFAGLVYWVALIPSVSLAFGMIVILGFALLVSVLVGRGAHRFIGWRIGKYFLVNSARPHVGSVGHVEQDMVLLALAPPPFGLQDACVNRMIEQLGPIHGRDPLHVLLVVLFLLSGFSAVLI